MIRSVSRQISRRVSGPWVVASLCSTGLPLKASSAAPTIANPSPGDYQTHTNSYVNVGLLLRTNLFKGIYSTQGPQFMLPVSGKLRIQDADLDVKDNINSDISLVVGLGRQFGRIGIEGRWDSGFKRIEDAPLGNFIKRNRAITVIGIVAF